MKQAAVVVLCTLAGVAAGGIWTLLQSDRYRAEARVLVKPLDPAVETLAESSLIEANVAQTLHLASPPNVSATEGKGDVLTIAAEAGARERARQIDAEAVVILTQKIPQRFAGATATVLDPAHVAAQTSPTPGRNLLIGGLAGLVVGIAAAAVLARGREAATTAAALDPRSERRLQKRIDEVARRERALAQRAGQLAAREHELERRQAELTAPDAHHVEPLREPEATPEPPVEPAALADSGGRWTLHALETLTSERTEAGASEAQQEEWMTYLFLLREHAAADGTLPASFDHLVNEVFGPLPHPGE